ncbi:MAG TPA: hypothetical protein VEG60_06780 [Candidatus Binatia bacterium]|nr:hypothetical protein [Candidatus Binatia bacterium]
MKNELGFSKTSPGFGGGRPYALRERVLPYRDRCALPPAAATSSPCAGRHRLEGRYIVGRIDESIADI